MFANQSLESKSNVYLSTKKKQTCNLIFQSCEPALNIFITGRGLCFGKVS